MSQIQIPVQLEPENHQYKQKHNELGQRAHDERKGDPPRNGLIRTKRTAGENA